MACEACIDPKYLPPREDRWRHPRLWAVDRSSATELARGEWVEVLIRCDACGTLWNYDNGDHWKYRPDLVWLRLSVEKAQLLWPGVAGVPRSGWRLVAELNEIDRHEPADPHAPDVIGLVAFALRRGARLSRTGAGLADETIVLTYGDLEGRVSRPDGRWRVQLAVPSLGARFDIETWFAWGGRGERWPELSEAHWSFPEWADRLRRNPDARSELRALESSQRTGG